MALKIHINKEQIDNVRSDYRKILKIRAFVLYQSHNVETNKHLSQS